MPLSRSLALAHGLVAAVVLLAARLHGGDGGAPRIAEPLFFGLAVAAAAAAGGLLGRLLRRPLARMTAAVRAQGQADEGPWRELTPAAPRELRDLNRALRAARERLEGRIAGLSAERSRHEAILDSITEGILVTDGGGRILMANRALGELFGLDPPVAGRRPLEVIRNASLAEAIDRVLRDQGQVDHEIVLQGSTPRHFDVKVAAVTAAGRLAGTVAVLYEVTRLRRLERMRADFVANVSHELRTPLAAIQGSVETLADGALRDPAAAARFVEVIGSQAERLTRLLGDLLELSRLESEGLQIEPRRHSLRRLVDTACDAVRGRAAGRDLGLQVRVPADLEVACDGELIEQALVNLVDNAVKYTPRARRVVVGARRLPRARARQELAARQWRSGGEGSAGDAVIVQVVDSGIGIPSDAVERVCERFYRVDRGRSRETGGTGLGLSIVRHVVELHGEALFIDSELNRGSTFGFTLPAA